MSLREQGYRFMMSPDHSDYNWVHPSEIACNAERFRGYTDCTDMSNDEFATFLHNAATRTIH